MKRLKISFIAVIAVVIAIAGSAFTVKHSVKKADTYYFQYTGESLEGLLVESNWMEVDGSPVDGCTNNSGINCVIELNVPPVSGEPDFSSAGITDKAGLDLVTDAFRGE